ncbi:hypothetical protein BH789_gp076 [Gordonia phage GMA6]|uniref:Uncharacterized protein n=1 Tax=Gordonia phage GMA6 TaxID=1647285 RepID=A0A0K0NLC7_9CAUD|nr:hypothetical protein BH789_gp076 [Gordonia phage GMA6]AKL88357.1 hypothetical protein GMA6_76 [Gordonia phage GMA6]
MGKDDVPEHYTMEDMEYVRDQALKDLFTEDIYRADQLKGGSIGLFQQQTPGFNQSPSPSLVHHTSAGTSTNNMTVASKDEIVSDALNAHRTQIDKAQERIADLEKEVAELKQYVRELSAAVNRRPVLKKRGETQ